MVANQKAKEAAEADLARAKVEAERSKSKLRLWPTLKPSPFASRLQLEIERAARKELRGIRGR